MAAETNPQQDSNNPDNFTDGTIPIEYPVKAAMQDSFRVARGSEDEPLVNTIDLREGFYYSI